MHANAQLLQKFYTAFQQKDYTTMQSCYADNAIFSDEAFVNLNASEVKAMWEMLIKKGKDLQLNFSNIEADDVDGSAEWIATYTFSQTNRKVTNHIKASFKFANEKIIAHTDEFSFYKWSSQALGTIGIIMVWTGWLKNKVQTTARKNLTAFMKTNQS